MTRLRQTWAALLLAASAAGADNAPREPAVAHFVDETAAAGVFSRFDGEWEYMVGGGVAAFDCDDDGLPELLFTGGVNKARFFKNQSPRGGALQFKETRSGLEVPSALGAYPIDIDGDGRLDLVLLRVGETVLYRGLGECRFERANEAWNFDGGNQWNTAFSATWEAGQAWPTLAIGTYIDRTRQDEPWGSCTTNRLYRPAPGGGYLPPVELKPGFCALSMLFTDWGRTGAQDLRISNDREYYKGGQEQLWRIRAGEAPRAYTAADGWAPLQIWGMGIAGHDLDGDGYPSYVLTSMADNKLQKLEPPAGGPVRPVYRDVAFAHGTTAHRPYVGGDVHPSTAWHAQFEDVNNDGLADLFIVKGNVGGMAEFAMIDPNNLLLGRSDGRFVESGQQAGIAGARRGRGGLLVDLNGDGLLDMAVVNHRDKVQVWRNVGGGSAAAPKPMGRWVEFRPLQPEGNRDAVGTWIEVRVAGRVQRREITIGGGHASGQLGWVHFGLGEARQAQVRVLWPGGGAGDWAPVAADTRYVLQPRQTPSIWKSR
ncbi:MAG TPA: CRTAC1 family protein [Burkholderiaceae bacterium]|nr:CRTAC1 family protein [Burkholderiaceae bacterium]